MIYHLCSHQLLLKYIADNRARYPLTQPIAFTFFIVFLFCIFAYHFTFCSPSKQANIVLLPLEPNSNF